MKRYLMSTVVVLVVLVVVIAAVGQPERSGRGLSGRMNREARMEAIKTVEAQLAKLKEEPQIPRPQGGYQNMSEEERTKFREQMMTVFRERQKMFQVILAQVFRLQGRRPPEGEGVQYLILSTNDLKPIQAAAAKEKATETGKLLEQLIARGSGRRGFGGRRPGSGERPERPTRQRQR